MNRMNQDEVQAARRALMDYYGTAAHSGMPMAYPELSCVEAMGDEEIIEEAQRLQLI